MRRQLSLNHNTGIQRRSSIINQDHPLLNQEDAPSISQLHRIFVQEGVPLAVRAAQKALQEAQIDKNGITHIICTTNTDSGSPGIDRLLKIGLGVTASPEMVLLHGTGALGTLRTAANLALGYTALGKPAHILCIALEINTTMLRSELDSVHELQEARSGACLFSDCASAVLLSNSIGEAARPVFELLHWNQRTIPDTEKDFGFDVHQTGKSGGSGQSVTRRSSLAGWKAHLSHRLPNLLNGALGPGYIDLIGMPQSQGERPHPAKFDWAMDPFGGAVLSGAEDTLDITAKHLRASYEVYNKHGHSGSAALFSVLDRLRSKEMDSVTSQGVGRDYVIGCSFAPGIVLDMCMLRRPKCDGRDRSGAPQRQSRTGSETSTTTPSGDTESLGSDESLRPARGGHVADALKSLDLDHME
jgi:type III polyketide synthase